MWDGLWSIKGNDLHHSISSKDGLGKQEYYDKEKIGDYPQWTAELKCHNWENYHIWSFGNVMHIKNLLSYLFIVCLESEILVCYLNKTFAPVCCLLWSILSNLSNKETFVMKIYWEKSRLGSYIFVMKKTRYLLWKNDIFVMKNKTFVVKKWYICCDKWYICYEKRDICCENLICCEMLRLGRYKYQIYLLLNFDGIVRALEQIIENASSFVFQRRWGWCCDSYDLINIKYNIFYIAGFIMFWGKNILDSSGSIVSCVTLTSATPALK